VHPAVGPSQPRGDLVVEVPVVTKATSGQERGLVVEVPPFVHSLGLGVVRLAESGAGTECAPEGLEVVGEDLLSPPPLADAALAVPDDGAGDASELLEAAKHPPQHVIGGS
jgi:hypothetical protein